MAHQNVDTLSAFLLLWALVVTSMLALAVACLATGVAIRLASILFIIGPNLAIAIGSYTVRRFGWPPLANALLATGQMAIINSALIAFGIILASTNLPLRDAELMAFDRALGID